MVTSPFKKDNKELLKIVGVFTKLKFKRIGQTFLKLVRKHFQVMYIQVISNHDFLGKVGATLGFRIF